MNNNPSTFTEKAQNPVYQVIVVAIGLLITMLLVKIVIMGGATIISNRVFWIIAGTAVLFYSLFNSIISLNASDMNTYWTRSTLCYAALMISSGFMAYVFSSMTMSEAGTFKWIFMVLTFGYLLFLSMMRFMRKIVHIAQKEDNKWMGRMK